MNKIPLKTRKRIMFYIERFMFLLNLSLNTGKSWLLNKDKDYPAYHCEHTIKNYHHPLLNYLFRSSKLKTRLTYTIILDVDCQIIELCDLVLLVQDSSKSSRYLEFDTDIDGNCFYFDIHGKLLKNKFRLKGLYGHCVKQWGDKDYEAMLTFKAELKELENAKK